MCEMTSELDIMPISWSEDVKVTLNMNNYAKSCMSFLYSVFLEPGVASCVLCLIVKDTMIGFAPHVCVRMPKGYIAFVIQVVVIAIAFLCIRRLLSPPLFTGRQINSSFGIHF